MPFIGGRDGREGSLETSLSIKIILNDLKHFHKTQVRDMTHLYFLLLLWRVWSLIIYFLAQETIVQCMKQCQCQPLRLHIHNNRTQQ